MDLQKQYGTIGTGILEKYCKDPEQLKTALIGKLTAVEIDNLLKQIESLREHTKKE